jgi:nucleoside-diphosphate-sugar epimerase
MKIFLTGGTGFIGSHYLNLALAHGIDVVALRRHPSSQPRIPLTRQPTWLDRPFQLVTESDLQDVDILIHLSAHSANVPYDSLGTCLYWNLMQPLRLFEVARKAGVKRFLLAGSCFEYGRSGPRYERIPADAPLEPTQSYPASKAAASLACIQWALEYGLILAILRPFQVFGEGELATRLWPSLCQAALEGADFKLSPADQIRDFINVDCVARQFLGCSQSLMAMVDPVVHLQNVGSGIPQSVYQFAQSVWLSFDAKGQLLKGALPYRQGELMRFVPDLTPVTVERESWS